MKLLILAVSLLIGGCSTTERVIVKYADTCGTKIVNLKYYTMKPPMSMPIVKRVYQYWRVDKTDDTTAIIKLVYDTLYYSKDLNEWYRIKNE